jgi:hypothetical protein
MQHACSTQPARSAAPHPRPARPGSPASATGWRLARALGHLPAHARRAVPVGGAGGDALQRHDVGSVEPLALRLQPARSRQAGRQVAESRGCVCGGGGCWCWGGWCGLVWGVGCSTCTPTTQCKRAPPRLQAWRCKTSSSSSASARICWPRPSPWNGAPSTAGCTPRQAVPPLPAPAAHTRPATPHPGGPSRAARPHNKRPPYPARRDVRRPRLPLSGRRWLDFLRSISDDLSSRDLQTFLLHAPPELMPQGTLHQAGQVGRAPHGPRARLQAAASGCGCAGSSGAGAAAGGMAAARLPPRPPGHAPLSAPPAPPPPPPPAPPRPCRWWLTYAAWASSRNTWGRA